MHRILLVEDDPVIANELQNHLQSWGYEVFVQEGFGDVEAEFARISPHLVLMDLMLSGRNGFHWCRQIRIFSKVPILFVTSAGDNLTLLTALSLGADDLISKPFDLQVLTAKMEALLRRAYGFVAEVPVLSHQGLRFDPAASLVFFGDMQAELTRNESRILQTLFASPGSIVSREKLMLALWQSDSFVDENTLTVNVARLRRKLEDLGMKDPITTHKGQGYRL